MARHVGSVKGSIEPPIVYRGTCTCGAQGPLTGSRADADWWIDQHLIAAARAQAHRSSRQPTLEDQAKWFREMEKAAGDHHTKEQWAQLAAELEHRLGQDEHAEQPPMF
jgi:hypothetical protein